MHKELLLLLFFSAPILCTDNLIRLPIIHQQTNTLLLQKRDNIPIIPLYNANAKEYLIEIGIGSPAQLFNVTLDTGR